MNYILHIAIMVGIYAILSLSLNILVGQAGLLSLCHAAFYGIGAYATTLVMMKADFPFPIALASAVIVAALLSTIISVPTLRLRGDYFVLGSLAFQVIVYTVLHNWEGLTAGRAVQKLIRLTQKG